MAEADTLLQIRGETGLALAIAEAGAFGAVRTAPELWLLTALAVPAVGRQVDTDIPFDATTQGAAADRFVELTGRAPTIRSTHQLLGASHGDWLGWRYDAEGFHVVAVTMLRPYRGDCVSIGHKLYLTDTGMAGSEWIGELSLLEGSRVIEGAVVESVEPFTGSVDDVRWLGEMAPVGSIRV